MTNKYTSGKSVYEIVTEKIIDKLQAGEIPWKKPWKNDGSMPANFISKRQYNGMNLFLLPREYATNWFLTFKQVSDLGYFVKKGEKGHIVVFWKFLKNTEKKSDGTEKEKTIPMLRYYTVFNVAQTTIPEEKIPQLVRLNVLNSIEQCETVISNMPNRPQIKTGESKAYYQPNGDFVNMPQKGLFDDEQNYYSVLFHEIGHSTGHESRLNRQGIAFDTHGFGSKSYSREELVAEMTAAFLCGHCSIETATIDNSAAYIQSWVKNLKDDPRCVVVAAGQAQKAANYVLGISDSF